MFPSRSAKPRRHPVVCCGPPPAIHQVRGKYKKLLCSSLHRSVERWYSVEASAKQKKAFKRTLTGIWDMRTQPAPAAAAPKSTSAAMADRRRRLLFWRTYFRGLLNSEYRGAAERWCSHSSTNGLDDCRIVFSALSVLKKRLDCGTEYKASYPEYDRDDVAHTRHRPKVETDEKQVVWTKFRQHNPPRPPPPRSVSCCSERGAETAGGGGVCKDYSTPWASQKPVCGKLPYALFFDEDACVRTTESRDEFIVRSAYPQAPTAAELMEADLFCTTASAGLRVLSARTGAPRWVKRLVASERRRRGLRPTADPPPTPQPREVVRPQPPPPPPPSAPVVPQPQRRVRPQRRQSAAPRPPSPAARSGASLPATASSPQPPPRVFSGAPHPPPPRAHTSHDVRRPAAGVFGGRSATPNPFASCGAAGMDVLAVDIAADGAVAAVKAPLTARVGSPRPCSAMERRYPRSLTPRPPGQSEQGPILSDVPPRAATPARYF
eukprot:TRINITY_DN3004_c0_g2_i1.p1 TRINITY_DN3004_c0_g2~~TRINITY_DN3004_c0_g2_i1.p1  ORF type:complete len:492 (+),score=115.36 TRINITY_DN3004_c0_g2_i1:67-1542(+)